MSQPGHGHSALTRPDGRVIERPCRSRREAIRWDCLGIRMRLNEDVQDSGSKFVPVSWWMVTAALPFETAFRYGRPLR
jgi:hypothetical protein